MAIVADRSGNNPTDRKYCSPNRFIASSVIAATAPLYPGEMVITSDTGERLRGLSTNTGAWGVGGQEESSGNPLGLPVIAWEGGSAYWGQFPKAAAAGWTSPTFFPIAVFLGKNDNGHPTLLRALGINTYCPTEGQRPMTLATDAGLFVVSGSSMTGGGGFTPEEIGDNPMVVGWFVTDECDMGLGGCTLPTEEENLALFQGWCNSLRALNDGRFLMANWGNGILGTFWSPNTMDDFVRSVDVSGVDKYAYTSPQVRFEFGRSGAWNAEGGTEANSKSCAAYGWMARRMKNVYENPSKHAPFWVVPETKMPYLADDGRTVISYAQIEAAVFSAIANEARGILYFQHNGFYDLVPPGGPGAPATDPNTGAAPTTETYSLAEGLSGLKDFITGLNGRVTALAPVLNTQSYVWNFGTSGLDTMLKQRQGFVYIFASVGVAGTTGSKTFTLPTKVNGTTVTVLDEARTLPVTAKQFTDTFATEASHHVYRVAI